MARGALSHGGQRARPVARCRQAVPLRDGVTVFRDPLGGIPAFAREAGRRDERRGGCGFCEAAIRRRCRAAPALGRPWQDLGHRGVADRELPAGDRATGALRDRRRETRPASAPQATPLYHPVPWGAFLHCESWRSWTSELPKRFESEPNERCGWPHGLRTALPETHSTFTLRDCLPRPTCWRWLNRATKPSTRRSEAGCIHSGSGGGAMSAEEASAFAVRLRRWDLRGEVAGIEVPP